MTTKLDCLKIKLFRKPIIVADYSEMFYKDWSDYELEEMVHNMNKKSDFSRAYSIMDADAHKDCGCTSIYSSSHREYFDYYQNAIVNNFPRILTSEEFYAIYHAARNKASHARRCLAVMKFILVLIIIGVIIFNIFFAGRIPKESEYIDKYQKMYITLEVGQNYDLYTTTYLSELRSVRINNFDSIMKLIEVRYPDTLESGIYTKRDLKEEINTINRGTFDVLGYFTIESHYVTIPILVGKEVDYASVQPVKYQNKLV